MHEYRTVMKLDYKGDDNAVLVMEKTRKPNEAIYKKAELIVGGASPQIVSFKLDARSDQADTGSMGASNYLERRIKELAKREAISLLEIAPDQLVSWKETEDASAELLHIADSIIGGAKGGEADDKDPKRVLLRALYNKLGELGEPADTSLMLDLHVMLHLAVTETITNRIPH